MSKGFGKRIRFASKKIILKFGPCDVVQLIYSQASFDRGLNPSRHVRFFSKPWIRLAACIDNRVVKFDNTRNELWRNYSSL